MAVEGQGADGVSPSTSVVKAYATQFGLGGEYCPEIWREIENYASHGRLDDDMLANPGKYAAFTETTELRNGARSD